MDIDFDVVTDEYRYPLTREQVKSAVSFVECDLGVAHSRIRAIRFGCNRRTTQEGRIVEKGSGFYLRVNFCPRNGASRMLAVDKHWTNVVATCGGRVNAETREILWPDESASRYGLFLLYHELGHIVHGMRSRTDGLVIGRGGMGEERFCDRWALRRMNDARLVVLGEKKVLRAVRRT